MADPPRRLRGEGGPGRALAVLLIRENRPEERRTEIHDGAADQECASGGGGVHSGRGRAYVVWLDGEKSLAYRGKRGIGANRRAL